MDFSFQQDWIRKNKGVRPNGRLPANIDLEQALMCAELSTVSYRHFTRGKTVTSKTLAAERQHIEKYAKVFGFHCKVLSTATQQCVIFYNDREVVVAFEGSSQTQLTHYSRNLSSYFLSLFKEAPPAIVKAAQEEFGRDDVVAKVHWGFDNALNERLADDASRSLWQGIRRELEDVMAAKPERKLFFTGHSSGGAIATIATARALDELPQHEVRGLYTFGQPRVGGKYFRAGLHKLLGQRYFRFEQYGDPMPALPPYNEEEYVHGGHWIPMDALGHVLCIADGNDTKDTLSHTDQEWTGIIGRAYQSLMGGLNAIKSMLGAIGSSIADRSEILRELSQSIDPVARSTHATLHNLFGVQNYSLHRATTYSKSLTEYMRLHQHSPHRKMVLAEHDAQHILYHLQSLEDILHDGGRVKLPQVVKDAMATLQQTLHRNLDEWQMTQENPPQVWLHRSEKLQDQADSAGRQLWQWFFGSDEPDLKGPEEFEDVPGSNGSGRSFSAARTVRAIQRASRIEKLSDAINQFRHDIGPYAASPKAGYFLRGMSELADNAYELTSQFKHPMKRGICSGQMMAG